MRPELLKFAAAMEKTLKQNDHKVGWKGFSVFWLMERLYEEVGELEKSFMNPPEDIRKQAQKECVDVANFAMMIFDVLQKKS